MNLKYSIRLEEDQLKFISAMGSSLYKPYESIRGLGWISEKLGWPTRKTERIVRQSFGILGIIEYIAESPNRGYSYGYLIVPEENSLPLKNALQNGGKFEKEIKQHDLMVLNSIYQRDKELRQIPWYGPSPRFYLAEISKRSRMGKWKTKSSLKRLVGILGKALIKTIALKNGEDTYVTYSPRWFLPTVRISDAEKVLQEYSRQL